MIHKLFILLAVLFSGLGLADATKDHTIFISSIDIEGDFGGMRKADLICRDLAKKAGLEGIWIALLSDSKTDMRERINRQGRVLNIMGEVVAENVGQLFTGDTKAVAFTEKKLRLEGLPPVWTGSSPDGRGDGFHCGDWTLATGSDPGTQGLGNKGGTDWLTYYVADDCDFSGHLYCVN